MEPTSTRRRLGGRTTQLAAVLLTCLLLAGCSASGSSDSPDPGVAEPGFGGSEGGGSDNGGGVDGGAVDGDQGEDRAVVSTASLSLTSTDPVAAADRAVDIVIDVDGHVDSRTDIPTDEFQQEAAQLVLRIPSDDLDETLVKLRKVGKLERSSLNQTDVTTQVADLDARITALQTSVDRLLALMAKATTAADLIDLESALSQRQAELDGLTAQRESLGDRVDFATVEMYITTPGEVAGAAPGDFWGGVVVGFQALLNFIGGLLVVAGVLLPWIVVIGLLAVLTWWLIHRARRRRPVPPADERWDDDLPPRPPLPPTEAAAPAESSTR